MSTKPGETTWPPASSTRFPSSPSPMSLTTPSDIAMSAVRAGAPVPSTREPPRMTMSAVMGIPLVRAADVPVQHSRPPPPPAPTSPTTPSDGVVRRRIGAKMTPSDGAVGDRLTLVSGFGDSVTMAITEVPSVMPAAVFMGLKDVAVEERPTPQPGPGELLLEVSHCGLCGSDLHFLVEWGGRTDVIEGHEFSGTVAALGPDVTGWTVGDRVVPGQSVKCGECEYCRAGRVSLCIARGRVGADDEENSAASWGAFARYKIINAANALRVP